MIIKPQDKMELYTKLNISEKTHLIQLLVALSQTSRQWSSNKKTPDVRKDQSNDSFNVAKQTICHLQQPIRNSFKAIDR